MRNDNIPIYETSNDFHREVGFDHISHNPLFDVFSIELLDSKTHKFMPPYRQGYYLIGLLSYFGNTKLNVDTDYVQAMESTLIFVVPGQVFSWLRDQNTTGYFVLFKKEFITSLSTDYISEFPFLKITEPNNYILNKDEYSQIECFIQQIIEVFNSENNYQDKILQHLLFATLYFCKSIHNQYSKVEESLSKSRVIVSKFESLVEKMYIEVRNVNEYANLLHVTPSYLSQSVKNITGRSTKSIVKDRLFVESKNLLKYSNLTISEIAYRLKFDEATHFTRFFKSMSNLTPSQFRNI